MKYKKLAAGLLAALEDLQTEGRPALIMRTRTLGVASVTHTQKRPGVIVFVHCDKDAKVEGLASEVRLNQTQGAVRTAYLPLEKVGDLSEDPKVKRIVASRKLKPSMDVASPRVGVPKFVKKSGLTGEGVIVGIIDSGIDPNHTDFRGRILRIWDQNVSGPGVAEGGYGLELSGVQLTASRDRDGHGTHVAGIAAGAGSKFPGVAPAAQLVIVNTSFQDAHIADGIRYIFRIAKELSRPAVVNLSLGGHSDPHDGSDSLAQIINEESGPGRIVCCAAGNEGDDNIHSRVQLGAPAIRAVRFKIPADTVGIAELNGWYPGKGKLEISVTAPNGFSTPFQPVIATGKFLKKFELRGARVTIETPDKDPDNGDHHFSVSIRGATATKRAPGGKWALRVKNSAALSGFLDVWALDDQDSPQVIFSDRNVSDSMKIGSPGTAGSAITVGAFVTRNAWKDVDGKSQEVEMTLDDIASFSSEGPARDNAKKPDVTAPGAMIASGLSDDSAAEREDIIDRTHVLGAGTSMATPFITGVIALLLERKPTLDPAAAKTALRKVSKIPGKAAGSFDPKWGFGLLDASKL